MKSEVHSTKPHLSQPCAQARQRQSTSKHATRTNSAFTHELEQSHHDTAQQDGILLHWLPPRFECGPGRPRVPVEGVDISPGWTHSNTNILYGKLRSAHCTQPLLSCQTRHYRHQHTRTPSPDETMPCTCPGAFRTGQPFKNVAQSETALYTAWTCILNTTEQHSMRHFLTTCSRCPTVGRRDGHLVTSFSTRVLWFPPG